MPEAPWHLVRIDFIGPLPSSEYLLVVIDCYSRYPEVETVHSTKASSVIPKVDRISATHGNPYTIKTNNGRPFSSDDFHKYCTALGMSHEKVASHITLWA